MYKINVPPISNVFLISKLFIHNSFNKVFCIIVANFVQHIRKNFKKYIEYLWAPPPIRSK